MRPDTEIGLEFQGLTGIASLSLKGGTGEPVPPARRTIRRRCRRRPGANADVTQNARDVLRRLDQFIAENQSRVPQRDAEHRYVYRGAGEKLGKIDSTLANIDRFSKVLADNSERIDHIAQGLENLTGGATARAARSTRPRARSQTVIDNRRQAHGRDHAPASPSSRRPARKQIESLSTDAQRTSSNIDRAVTNLDKNPSRLLWGGRPVDAAGDFIPDAAKQAIRIHIAAARRMRTAVVTSRVTCGVSDSGFALSARLGMTAASRSGRRRAPAWCRPCRFPR